MNKENDLGLIHIYCGNGKGKTTASMGLGLRAIGRGYRVLVLQFLKDGESNELKMIKQFENVLVISGKPVKKFTMHMNDDEKNQCKKVHEHNFSQMLEHVANGGYDVLIMDEVINAISTNTFDEGMLTQFLKEKPNHLEVVMTGRNPSENLIKIADYVSVINSKKHPYDRGVMAREGIEK